jgi:hypothetical protein
MVAVQPIPDDEIAAELAASWGAGDPDEPPPAGLTDPVAPAGRRAGTGAGSGLRRRPTDLRQAAELVRPVTLAHEQVLPLSPAFAGLLPGGLPRGATVVVSGAPGPGSGTGATAVALALVASASGAGSWVATVGLPALGLAAAAEAGVAVERLVVIEPPPAEHWGTVVGALVGAFDAVLLGAPARASRAGAVRGRPAEVRRLIARSRERGSVLVQLAGPVLGAAATDGRVRPTIEPSEADLRIAVGPVRWEGLAVGHGLLRRRRATVEVSGRRAATRARRAELWLPDGEGRVRPVEPAEATGHGEVGEVGPDLTPAARPRIRRARRPAPVPRPPAAAGAWPDAG